MLRVLMEERNYLDLVIAVMTFKQWQLVDKLMTFAVMTHLALVDGSLVLRGGPVAIAVMLLWHCLMSVAIV